MPHFVVQYRNTGNVPVTFSDFELILPRHAIFQDGQYVSTLGADFFLDKRKSSRVGSLQHIKSLDYRTNKVRLEAGESHTDYFDLGAFLPDLDTTKVMNTQGIPPGFDPILKFTDSWENEIVCDRWGVADGPWKHTDWDKLVAAGYRMSDPSTLTATQRTLSRRWRFQVMGRKNAMPEPEEREISLEEALQDEPD